MFVESAFLAPEASRGAAIKHLCPAPRVTPALQLSRLLIRIHLQGQTLPPFLLPVLHPDPRSLRTCRAKGGSWGCSMGHRDGEGSVPRGGGKAWLGQQRPKPAWAVFQLPLGLSTAEGRALGCPCHTPKSGYESTSKSPCQHLLQGTHPALKKQGSVLWEHIYL